MENKANKTKLPEPSKKFNKQKFLKTAEEVKKIIEKERAAQSRDEQLLQTGR